MNFIRSFRAVVRKEFLHITRDPFTLIISIMIPVFQLIIFGYAIDMDVKNIPTAVYDADRRSSSRDFIATLRNTRYFDVREYVDSPVELYEAVRSGRVDVGIQIPPDFSAGMMGRRRTKVLVIIDGSNSTVAGQAMSVMNSMGLWHSMKRRGLESMEYAPVEVRPRMLFNPDLRSANFFVPGLVGLITQLVSVFLTAFAVVRERERGTMEQLLVTPLPRSALILGKLIPYALMAATETSLVLLIMRYVFGVEIRGSLPLLLVLSALFIFTGLGLGMLVSTAAQNQAQAMQLAFMIMLPSVMLSGFVFPRESMPRAIYYVTFLVPLTYYVEILRGIIIRGSDMASLWKDALILGFYGFAVLTLSTLRFRKRLG